VLCGGKDEKVESVERRTRLQDGGNPPKPDLTSLMNLFVGWGLAILKKKWLDRMGYK